MITVLRSVFFSSYPALYILMIYLQIKMIEQLGGRTEETKYVRVRYIILSTLHILKLFLTNVKLVMVHNVAAEIGEGGRAGEKPEIMRNLLRCSDAQLSSKGGSEDDLRLGVKVGGGHRDGEGPAGEDFLFQDSPVLQSLDSSSPLFLLPCSLLPRPPPPTKFPSPTHPPHPPFLIPPPPHLHPPLSFLISLPPASFQQALPWPGAQPCTGGPPSWFFSATRLLQLPGSSSLIPLIAAPPTPTHPQSPGPAVS